MGKKTKTQNQQEKSCLKRKGLEKIQIMQKKEKERKTVEQNSVSNREKGPGSSDRWSKAMDG